MIHYDFHVHLHGMLNADDLWELGRDRWQELLPCLSWYAQEYKTAWGRTPDFPSYWTSIEGRDRLAADFIIKQPVSFAQFQACFNLIIALCPLDPEDYSIQRNILQRASAKGLKYCEARTIIPPLFTEAQTHRYLAGLCAEVHQLNQDLPLETSLVWSLARQPKLRDQHYRWLRDFCHIHPHLAAPISGIDFAGWEEPFPPSLNREFLARCHQDNRQAQHLNLLYHVGESWEQLSLASSLRWIHQVVEMGVGRLGHAAALGCNPEALAGKIVSESWQEYSAHQSWLEQEADVLRDYGYHPLVEAKGAYRTAANEAAMHLTYTPAYIEDCRNLQDALARYLVDRSIVIESCPSSNRSLGGILHADDHPLSALLQRGLRIVLGTDDPGLFASDWQQEASYAAQLTGEPQRFAQEALHLYQAR